MQLLLQFSCWHFFFVYQHYQNRRSESSLKIKVNGHTIAYELRDSPSGSIVYGKEISADSIVKDPAGFGKKVHVYHMSGRTDYADLIMTLEKGNENSSAVTVCEFIGFDNDDYTLRDDMQVYEFDSADDVEKIMVNREDESKEDLAGDLITEVTEKKYIREFVQAITSNENQWMSEEGAEKNTDAECYVVRFGLKNGSIYRFYYTPADKLIERYGGKNVLVLTKQNAAKIEKFFNEKNKN